MKTLAFIFFCLYINLLSGQNLDSTNKAENSKRTDQRQSRPIELNGYAEMYYHQNANGPAVGNAMAFAYNHGINKKPAVNLLFIKASLNKERFRANIALATGSYMRANYANEKGFSKHILESNFGWKLSARKNWWLDIGVFSSHIGFESAIGKDCWTLSRSLAADNSPYFETGVKTTYISSNDQWLFSGLILTGWQTINIPAGTKAPSFGHQIQYRPDSKWVLNSSSFIGEGRFFHNLYAQYQVNNQLGITAGFDIGFQKIAGLNNSQSWQTPVMLVQYIFNEQFKMAVRAESFKDPFGIIVFTGTPNQFIVNGFSVNADYNISKKLLWRLELKQLNSKDAIFTNNNRMISSNLFSAITALAFNF